MSAESVSFNNTVTMKTLFQNEILQNRRKSFLSVHNIAIT